MNDERKKRIKFLKNSKQCIIYYANHKEEFFSPENSIVVSKDGIAFVQPLNNFDEYIRKQSNHFLEEKNSKNTMINGFATIKSIMFVLIITVLSIFLTYYLGRF